MKQFMRVGVVCAGAAICCGVAHAGDEGAIHEITDAIMRGWNTSNAHDS